MSAPTAYDFGPFRVDTDRRLLTREGASVPLAPKPFQLLLHFLRHAGRTLSKEHLIDTLWPGEVGTEANLSVNIAAVRRALGERPKDHRYVVTVPMQGYCFVADVHRTGANDRAEVETPTATADPRLLAVLPFRPSRSRAADVRLGVGFGDAVSDCLVSLSGWALQPAEIVRRTAPEATDPLARGRKLQADAVLSGSIERRVGRLAVSARLNLVDDGSTLWSDTYIVDPEGFPSLSRRIGRDVAQALDKNGQDPQNESDARFTENPDAFEEYLRGRFLLEETGSRAIESALDHFRRALELDPGFAAAQTAMASAYYRMWRLGQTSSHELARDLETAARRALELNPGLPEPYFWLASLNVIHHWNWSAAEALYERGLRLAPNSSLGHTLYSYYLALARRGDEAIAEARLGYTLAPTDLFANSTVANILRVTGHVEDAAHHFEILLQIAPEFLWGQFLWGWTLAALGRYEEAQERFEFLRGRNEMIPWALAGLAFTQARLGHDKTARTWLEKLSQIAAQDHVEPVILAFAHFGLNERDQTLEWLDKACEERNPVLVYQPIEPIWGALGEDPGFQAIFERIGAPE